MRIKVLEDELKHLEAMNNELSIAIAALAGANGGAASRQRLIRIHRENRNAVLFINRRIDFYTQLELKMRCCKCTHGMNLF